MERSRSASSGMALAVLLSPLWLGGCRDDGSGAVPAGGIDVNALPRLELSEEFRIGSVDDPDYGFSRIGGQRVAVDAEGQVWVWEALDREIRAYDGDGRLVRRLGGPGAGPGEFQSSQVVFDPGDGVEPLDDFSGREAPHGRAPSAASAPLARSSSRSGTPPTPRGPTR